MLKQHQPVIGQWYRRADRPQAFQVVASDRGERIVDVEYFDGTVDEWPLAHWALLDVSPCEPPLDCSGPYDDSEAAEHDAAGPERPWKEDLDARLDVIERDNGGQHAPDDAATMVESGQRRELLESQHRTLLDRLERLQADQRRETDPPEADSTERATQRENDEVVDQLERRTRDEMEQVERALARLSVVGGERCERCERPIGARRLAALPEATLCRDCASSAEASVASNGM
ncbi:MAG TPA: TraR/DksA C4-type zinc finger protein [Solimonas sp.]|nr:TraR/DksA C4-type zinc finger protein [Solimonas sp.]